MLALLMPALVDKRSIARRSQCSTQKNNLAKAAFLEEMSNSEYPGWLHSYGWFTGTDGDLTSPESNAADFALHQKLGSWVVKLLPYLDAQATYEVWTQDRYPLIRHDAYTGDAP